MQSFLGLYRGGGWLTRVPPRCTSSHSRFVRTSDATKVKMAAGEVPYRCRSLLPAMEVMSSIALPMDSDRRLGLCVERK